MWISRLLNSFHNAQEVRRAVRKTQLLTQHAY
eukprot:CAMPEP_0114292998 /NCGR_PEP_ID=MMETSP0059-20121206/9363_1 /TAXON_ID=36894 /ORGANISM="Pyramimonas parkeae, Strain CCMP726" /LENGTH=31 /DNA_ID= /DNA_START= /DNA_END= /DNA_ORIENTATION=